MHSRVSLSASYRVFAAVLIGLMPLAATAATIVVTSPDDTSPLAPTTCTLRQAILSMNAGALKGTCANSGAAFGASDTITFSAFAVNGGTYAGYIALADSTDTTGAVGGTLVVTSASLTIDASSLPAVSANPMFPGSVVIMRVSGDGAHDFGIVRGSAGTSLTLNAVMLFGGKVTGPDCGGADVGGGACMPGPNSALTLLNGAVYSNSASDGGAIYVDGTLNMTRSTAFQNTAHNGGAIYVTGSATITDCTISNNQAADSGGGLLTLSSLSLAGSSVVSNTASQGGGIFGDFGALGATLTLTNSTLAGNVATTQGGGINAWVPVTLTHVTAAFNQAPAGAGGGINQPGGDTVTLNNTILAGNLGGDSVGGTLSNNHSITSTANLNLGPPQYNGGPTPTMLPAAGSVAVDGVLPASACTFVAVDQRGVARPQGATCDVGAVEIRQPKLTAIVSGSGSVSAGNPPVPLSGNISNCTTSCSAFYFEGASVTLTPTPATGWHFAGWSGDCASSATVTMDANRTCTATFAVNTHAVGGTISNLAGGGLKLHLHYGVGNDEDVTPGMGATSYAFTSPVPYGATYAVSVTAQPTSLSQTCNVTANATGPMPDSDVSASVACSTNGYAIGGHVTGLTGSGLVLKLNGGNDLSVSGSDFTFLSSLVSGSSYIVSVGTQPSGQTCTIASGSGTVTNANVSNVAVSCGALQPLLTLAIDDSHDYARRGQLLTYLVTLSNTGGAIANSVAVLASTPAGGLNLANATWQCIGGGNGAVCAPTGSGALSDTVTLPASRTLTWIVNVSVLANASAATAKLELGATGATTVSDTDTLVIFRDGFNVANGNGTGSAEPVNSSP